MVSSVPVAPVSSAVSPPAPASSSVTPAITPAITPAATRWFGLDIHKEYLTAVAVDATLKVVFTANTVAWSHFPDWARKHLSKTDSAVIEMTTNTREVHDFLAPICHSVIVVHPPTISGMMPHNAKTDKHDATQLAQLHAAGLLAPKAVWIPPKHVRELRTLIANRYKVVRMATVAKNRLHNVLHRHHLPLPAGEETSHHPFGHKHKDYWLSLPNLSPTERLEVEMNWNTIEFADAQRARIEDLLRDMAAKDEAAALLQQVPGVGMIVAMTILGAIGDIARFKNATHLVGYAGLGARVSASGGKSHGGAITKAGRKDLRHAMVEAATHAIRCSKRWQREFARLEPRIGKSKAKIAIARRLLIMVWHVLSKAEADHDAEPVQVSTSLINFAYEVGIARLDGQRAVEFVRQQMDDLGIGAEMTFVQRNKKGKRLFLPPSRLQPSRANEVNEVNDPNAVIEPQPKAKAAYHFGCASLPHTPNKRTRAGRLLTGRSSPDGPKKKRKTQLTPPVVEPSPSS